MKTTRKIVAGRELPLKSENDRVLDAAVDVVNQSWSGINAGAKDETTILRTILTALNIAEKYNSEKNQNETNTDFLVSELEKMADYIKKGLELKP